jgi:hypothetical protein
LRLVDHIGFQTDSMEKETLLHPRETIDPVVCWFPSRNLPHSHYWFRCKSGDELRLPMGIPSSKNKSGLVQ